MAETGSMGIGKLVNEDLRYIKKDLTACLHYVLVGSDFIVKGILVDLIRVVIFVAMSTTEAEYIEAAQARKEAVWLKMLLEELGHKQEKITLFYDNRVPCILQGIQHFILKDKSIYEVWYHFVRRGKWKKEPWICRRNLTDDNVAGYYNESK
ncbi:hypothetical protein Tco_1103910 [Tanacetum coccineum]